VIDDDLAVRQAFSLTFADSPYLLDAAESGKRGLELADAQPYDLIFLDLRMPGMDGVQTLTELRRRGHNAPVYIVTAFHREFLGHLTELSRSGVEFEILSKPAGGDQLLAVARTVLEPEDDGPVIHAFD
jgi:DNA-binding response OmpR family regulator